MDTTGTLTTLGISLGLGLLVGLQRERKKDGIAGIRTFALLTVFGTVAALAGDLMGGAAGAAWSSAMLVAAGAVGVGALMAVGAFLRAKRDQEKVHTGMTTEIAALVMYGLGAFLGAGGDRTAALVLGGSVALVLYWKAPLHGFVRRMGDEDVGAIMRFVLIALVILPILPREPMGPYGVLNPFEIWLVVVLVVAISLAGYVIYKLVPPSAGAMLGGVIGGMISSTATTVSYARRTKGAPESATLALQAIMMANTVSVVRVMVLLTLFAGSAVGAMLPPLGLLAGSMGLLTAVAFWMGRHGGAEMAAQRNPAELRAALFFGAVYAAVKLATAWGRDIFGPSALYVVGGLSGSTDMDAVTLAMSDMARNGRVATDLATRVVVIAVLSNLVFKAGCVAVLGNRVLLKKVLVLFGATMICGVAILVFWR